MKIVFCGTGWRPIVDAIRERVDADVTIRPPEQPVAEAVADADIVLPSNGRIGEAEFEAATRLRLVQQPAAGYDGVDLDAAAARGIPVCNAPGANGDALAEAALLLMLGAARRVRSAQHNVATGVIGEPLGDELCGRTLVVIGRGRSGGRVAAVAEAMGMTVRAVRSSHSREERLALLSGAHVVSVHCPLNADTRGMIDDAAFGELARGAIFVNASRGPIVRREALEAALETGQVGAVGLDVGWKEPWAEDDPLLGRPEVFVLPHVGGSTHESFARIADIVAENIRRLVANESLLHRVR